MGKRSKQYRKLMQQYGIHFGFREPYQVLLDAEILIDTARVDILALLENSLHGKLKPMITTCCMRHLYATNNQTVISTAKNFERRRCNHQDLERPLSANECISSVVDPKDNCTNKHRYIVATQNESTRVHLRKVRGVPLLYFKRSVLIMEPMAWSSRVVKTAEERDKFRAGLKNKRISKVIEGRPSGERPDKIREPISESEIEDSADSDADADAELHNASTTIVPIKKKRGPPGPNPLSVLKSKKTKQQDNIRVRGADHEQSKTKRRRRGRKSHTEATADSAIPAIRSGVEVVGEM